MLQQPGSKEKGCPMYARRQENDDWEVSEDGLYIATRGYLIRRGFCCANRCRNCPYVNWRHRADWQPIPLESVRRTRTSAKSLLNTRAMLHYHEEQLPTATGKERERHQEMINHYQALLERWDTPALHSLKDR